MKPKMKRTPPEVLRIQLEAILNVEEELIRANQQGDLDKIADASQRLSTLFRYCNLQDLIEFVNEHEKEKSA